MAALSIDNFSIATEKLIEEEKKEEKKVKIYTKTGDNGYTQLLGGRTIYKASAVFDAIGDMDEVNSHLGLLIAEYYTNQISTIDSIDYDDAVIDFIKDTQSLLFRFGAQLAGAPIVEISDKIQDIEDVIDLIEKNNTPLKNFVLPGGCRYAAQIHLARTVVRRCERSILAIGLKKCDMHVFINRLSDFLFVYARWVNLLHNRDYGGPKEVLFISM